MSLPRYQKYPRVETPDGTAIRTEYGLILLWPYEGGPKCKHYVEDMGGGKYYLNGDDGVTGFSRPAQIYHRVRVPRLEEF